MSSLLVQVLFRPSVVPSHTATAVSLEIVHDFCSLATNQQDHHRSSSISPIDMAAVVEMLLLAVVAMALTFSMRTCSGGCNHDDDDFDVS